MTMANAILVHNLINAVTSNQLTEIGRNNSTASYDLTANGLLSGWGLAYIVPVDATIHPDIIIFYSPSLFTTTKYAYVAWGGGSSQFFESANTIQNMRVGVYGKKTTDGVHNILKCLDKISSNYSYEYYYSAIFYK